MLSILCCPLISVIHLDLYVYILHVIVWWNIFGYWQYSEHLCVFLWVFQWEMNWRQTWPNVQVHFGCVYEHFVIFHMNNFWPTFRMAIVSISLYIFIYTKYHDDHVYHTKHNFRGKFSYFDELGNRQQLQYTYTHHTRIYKSFEFYPK